MCCCDCFACMLLVGGRGGRGGGRSNDNEEYIDLLITGTKDAVADAKLLLDHHINFLKHVNLLSEEERKLADELNELTLHSGQIDRARGFDGRMPQQGYVPNFRGRGEYHLYMQPHYSSAHLFANIYSICARLSPFR